MTGPTRRAAAPFLLLAASACACSSTTYAPRPYRFEAPSNVAQETDRLAMRMSGDVQLRPAFVDRSTGTIYAAWRMTGASASITLWPPGERRGWHIERYRAFVRPGPNGFGSTVFVDLEQVECDSRGFAWTTVELRGDCRPITEMTGDQLRALDQKAASLGR